MKKPQWGLLLILVGLLFLVQESGFYLGLSFWSILLVVAGLCVVWSSVRHGPRWFTLGLGIWLTAAGAFNMLNSAGLTNLDGGDIFRKGWPLLLVAAGFSVLTGQRDFSVKVDIRDTDWRKLGDLRYGESSWYLDQDLTLEHGLGDVRVDLTTAEITPGHHRVDVRAGVGEVVVKVPDNVSVIVNATACIGELRVFEDSRNGLGLKLSKQVEVPGATSSLSIDAKLGIGSLRIVQRPAQPTLVVR